ncbi:hypothetical protein CBER1_00106 [Cercospora berteroae]|uniref:Uncharacterized protein n=1 Tax=Cercospora berteroae TaxID=357750 RepID=A0A2S6CD50_9PEZI|nr:hypothetical protein CBER1_00106 [Cercospora berteroae]
MDVLGFLDGIESATYYDKWSSWSLWLNFVHCIFSSAWAVILPILPHLELEFPPRNHYWGFDKWDGSQTLKECPYNAQKSRYECPEVSPVDGVPMYAYHRNSNIPTWEMWAALVPLILAGVNGPPHMWIKFRLFSYLQDERKRLTVFAITQPAQLVTCSLLVMADYWRHDARALFWIPLGLWFVPAVVCFVHGLTGLHAACLLYGPSIRLSESSQIEYQEVETPGVSALSIALESRRQSDGLLHDSTTLEADEDATEVDSVPPRYWNAPDPGVSVPLPAARFPWRVMLKNMRDGGKKIFWFPFTTNLVVAGFPYSCLRLTRARQRLDPETDRVMALDTLLPTFATLVASIALVVAMLQPRFTSIFVAVGMQVVAASIWFITCVVFITTWIPRPDHVIYVTPLFFVNHHVMALLASRLEWEPDLGSFSQMIWGRAKQLRLDGEIARRSM